MLVFLKGFNNRRRKGNNIGSGLEILHDSGVEEKGFHVFIFVQKTSYIPLTLYI